MQNIFLAIHIIIAVVLIGIVLIQRSEGGGLGVGGDQGGGGVMSSRGAATALTKITWILAALFLASSLAFTIHSAMDSGSASILDRFGSDIEQSSDAGTDIGSDLLPPVAPISDGALVPPTPAVPAAPATTTDSTPQ